MRNARLLMAGMLVALVLAGCNGEQPDQKSEAAGPVSVVKYGSPARASLRVVPGTVDSCAPGATIDPMVTWQRADPSVQKTRVTIDSPASPEQKLFSQAGFGGSARAGNWVVAGTRFHVYDDNTGIELISYTVTTTKPCAE